MQCKATSVSQMDPNGGILTMKDPTVTPVDAFSAQKSIF